MCIYTHTQDGEIHRYILISEENHLKHLQGKRKTKGEREINQAGIQDLSIGRAKLKPAIFIIIATSQAHGRGTSSQATKNWRPDIHEELMISLSVQSSHGMQLQCRCSAALCNTR